jgi:hypothetical protein
MMKGPPVEAVVEEVTGPDGAATFDVAAGAATGAAAAGRTGEAGAEVAAAGATTLWIGAGGGAAADKV